MTNNNVPSLQEFMIERALHSKIKSAPGFSLLELLIAMTVMLVMLSAASTLLTGSFNIRAREDDTTEALADVQRALNIMSREIGNSGYGLVNNGIVAADSNQSAIRVRANINTEAPPATNDPNEDVTFVYQSANSTIVRYDLNRGSNNTEVLADGLPPLAGGGSPLQISYFVRSTTGDLQTSAAAAAEVVRISLTAQLPAVNNQPASSLTMTSDVTLRNSILSRY